MKYNVEKDKLTLFLEGEVNSSNAEQIEKEIEGLLKEQPFKSIVFDLENLNYISSAGLRIIVKVKKQYDDTRLINVPHLVYDVFKMVGFQNLLKIERK